MKQHTKIIRNIKLGIENLLLHKLRSLLTMLGMVFGVGSVVAMLAVGEGASKEALEQIKKLGNTNIIISSMKSLDDEKANKTKREFINNYGLTYEDHQRIIESLDYVKITAPSKIIRKKARLKEKELEICVKGTTSAWFDLVKMPIIAGRILLPSDEEKRAPVAVLTEFCARKLLAGESTIGQHLRIGDNYFETVGIIKSEGRGGTGDLQIPDQQADVIIPLSVVRAYFGETDTRITPGSFEVNKVELHQIIVQVDSTKNVEKTGKALQKMLDHFHKKKDYLINIPLALLRQARATKRTFNIVLGSIACISLLVGGIGIMNIMLASVTERTREIGVRRAIGAKTKQIISQFLVETVVLSTIGGIVGIAFGVVIPLLITYFAGMPTVITMMGILLPLFISMGIGIIFGLYPAIRAAQVDPIVALRHE